MVRIDDEDSSTRGIWSLTQFRVPAVRVGVIIVVLDCCCIARLQVAQAGGLDIHEAVRAR